MKQKTDTTMWTKHELHLQKADGTDSLDFDVALAVVHTMQTATWNPLEWSDGLQQRSLPLFYSTGSAEDGKQFAPGTLWRHRWQDEAIFEFWTLTDNPLTQSLSNWLLEKSTEWPTVQLVLETHERKSTSFGALDGEVV